MRELHRHLKFRTAEMLILFIAAAMPLMASDVVITGVVDGPLTGGVPKAIELCVVNDVADLSAYGIGSANNGGGSDFEEFTFPAGSVSAGTFLYVASEAANFSTFFGFAPTHTSGAASINGDDAIELFMSGGVVDIFGDINVDGTGEAWEYLDGWAYRTDGTGPDGSTFVLANWSFSGPNALDGETTNATATTPFPIGAYSACEPQAPPPDLLLTEIVVTPTEGEFVELHNPTAAAIDLSDVYLTDATFAGGGTFYYNIVTGANAGGGGYADFHARFPDGATIGPGEYQTVSLAGSDDFFAAFGFDPTYELFEDGAADGVPDMREALPGSVAGQGGLSNGGEVVILYTWDGAADLVQDIDYALWGDAAEAVDKTGVSIDGPDGDAIASTYEADTAIATQDVIYTGSHSSGDSFQRVDFAEGIETQSGGNGITGSDETSEDLSVTWSLEAATPGAGPPPPPPTEGLIINEIHADPDGSLAGDANGDGIRDGSQDEFVEIVNVSGGAVDISGWTLSDGYGVRHTFPSGTVIPDQCGIVVFGGGTPTGSFGNMLVQTASGGSLGLNNGGDDVTLNDGSSDVAVASYGSEGGDDQSLTLDPDVTGTPPYVKHTLATGSGGALYSPGTMIDGSFFSGCPLPPASWVINEFHADPDGTLAGDANGDGIRDSSQDEFVEIVNVSGGAVDISGWTLSDGYGVRHTFPGGTLIPDQCGFVVFGGGTPTGSFGNMTLQTASTGSLGLNNGGDNIFFNNGLSDVAIAGYGSEGSDNQSLTLDPDVTGSLPFVKHSVASGSGGALFSPGTKIHGSQFEGCPQEREIFEIQGSGLASPFEGLGVITQGNVVTALGVDGFFMQTPSERSDYDIDTSDGIFVFTGSEPIVAVGDLVDVTGEVDEFYGMTEFTASSTVTVTGTGTVPAAVSFDAFVPSPNSEFPSCAIEYECYEGMLIEILDGTVTGPNQHYGTDPIAEVYIVASPQRAFREPGIEYPGLPTLPVWDGNPEVFELDPNKLGLENQMIPAGSSFSAVGVLGFEFGGYEFWPSELTVTPAALPLAVWPREPGEFTVATLNLFRLFDDVDDLPDSGRDDVVIPTAEYGLRLAKFSAHIREVLDAPDILAVQEAEKLGVLQDLAAQIAADDSTVTYTAYLVEGNDIGTIDVGFMVRDQIQVDAITQLGKDEILTYDGSLLHDRPPLLLEGSCQLEFGSSPIAVLAVHMRSLSGIASSSSGERVRQKRFEQAESVATMVQDIQSANPDVRLVVAGDFNAYEFTDGYVDVVGIIKGDFLPADNLICGTMLCMDIVEPDMTDEILNLPAEERYSFIFRGTAQALDHALTSTAIAPEISAVAFGRGNVDAAEVLLEDDGSEAPLPLRSSDHDGLVLYILNDEDNDGVPNDLDMCAGTAIPEGVPTQRLGTNRWALVDDDGIFDTEAPNGKGPKRSFTIEDTAGCSCEQIIDELHLGKGHEKFGCSNGAMENWVEEVQD